MRKRIALPVLTVLAVMSTLLVGSPASAHGYVSSPPSRQANCAQGKVKDCGAIQYEPQSVEGPKGLTSCSGGNSRFAVLDDESRGWPATSVGNTVTFNWVLTARHATSTWQYFVGGSKISEFNDGGKQPGATVSHSVSLGGRSGRIKVLAVWNIADTVNAFYSCIDLQVGGGSTNPPPPPATTPPTSPNPPTTPPVPPPAGVTTWSAGTSYAVGTQVSYSGQAYTCRQAHTALSGWEPPNVPALWQAG
jgi:predicted carbohydrate-binding protein with CBM5 and CBM33 domain